LGLENHVGESDLLEQRDEARVGPQQVKLDERLRALLPKFNGRMNR
jgi:hypothetical protein